jgi:site-specific DNA-methyltransferase (adenine-specific)
MIEKFNAPGIRLFHGHNLELLKATPDQFYDLAIVDPPYGIGIDKNKRIGKRGKTYSITNYKRGSWDKEIPPPVYFKELFRVSKNQIIFGGNYFIENLYNTRCVLFWSKQYIPEGFSMADCEMVWTSFKQNSKMIRVKLSHNNISNNEVKARAKAKIHATQKPVQLYEAIIKMFAKPGDKILDTHCGSGSIMIAIDRMNNFDKMDLSLDAIEIDPIYVKDSITKFETTKQQKTIQWTQKTLI